MTQQIYGFIEDDLAHVNTPQGKALRKKALLRYYENPATCKSCGSIIIPRHNKSVYDTQRRKYCSCKCSTKDHKKQKQRNTCEYCSTFIYSGSKNMVCAKCYKDVVLLQRRNIIIQEWLKTGEICSSGYIKIPAYIKDYVIRDQDNKCEICGMENQWNGKHLVFILDHIDGDALNNHRKNLRAICPNCDSQLDTYKSKNKHSSRKYRRKYSGS